MSAPTRFVRDWIVSRYADKILDIIKTFKKSIERIEFLIEETQEKSTKSDFLKNNKITLIENSLLIIIDLIQITDLIILWLEKVTNLLIQLQEKYVFNLHIIIHCLFIVPSEWEKHIY